MDIQFMYFVFGAKDKNADSMNILTINLIAYASLAVIIFLIYIMIFPSSFLNSPFLSALIIILGPAILSFYIIPKLRSILHTRKYNNPKKLKVGDAIQLGFDIDDVIKGFSGES